MSHQYAHYLPSDFDDFDCLKISKGVYLLLILVLRGYLIWIMSVTNMNDKTGVMQWFYPEPKFFYLSLLSGSVGLFVLLIFSLRRPDAKPWVKSSWRKIRLLLIFTLLFDLAVNIAGYLYWQNYSPNWIIANIIIVLGFIVYLFGNKRVQINIEEFPEKLPTK